MSDTYRGRAHGWIILGIAALDVGAALFALPWFGAAIGAIPFAGPWPSGYLIVAAVAAVTALVDVAIWKATARLERASWD